MLVLLESMRKVMFCRRIMAAWRAKLNDGDIWCFFCCIDASLPLGDAWPEGDWVHIRLSFVFFWLQNRLRRFAFFFFFFFFLHCFLAFWAEERLLLADCCRNPWRLPCLQQYAKPMTEYQFSSINQFRSYKVGRSNEFSQDELIWVGLSLSSIRRGRSTASKPGLRPFILIYDFTNT